MSKKIRSSIERLTIDLCDAILDEIENETGKRPKITSDSIILRINGEKSGMRPIKSPSSNNSSKICLSTKINGEPCILKATKEGDWKYCGKHKSNLDHKKDTNESHKSKKESNSDLQSNSSSLSSNSSSSKSSKKKKNKKNVSEFQRKAIEDKTKNNSLSSSSEKEKQKSIESQKTSKKKAEQTGREQSSNLKKKNSLSSSSSSSSNSSNSEKKNKLKSSKTQKNNATKIQYKENSTQNIDLEPFGNYFKIAGTSFVIFNKDSKLETVGVEKKEEDSILIKQLSASDRKTIMTVYPSVTIPPDTRMKELTDLFSLTLSVEEKNLSLKQKSEDEIKLNTSKQNESESQIEHSKSSNRNEKSENKTPRHSSADSKSEMVKKDTQSLPEKIVINKKRSKKNDSSSSSSSSLSNDEKKKKKKTKTKKIQKKDSSSESS